MEEEAKKFDLIVIGSGIAGVHAALLASEKGLKVGLIEKAYLGGSTANKSDVPLAVLSEVAQAIFETKDLTKLGVRTNEPTYNFPTIAANIKQAVKRASVTNKEFYQNNGITLIEGNAYFLSPNKISVNNKHYIANKFLIASGANWSVPKIAGLSEIDFMTPDSIVNLDRLPKSIFIIGGHPSAVLIAQIMAILGVKVHFIQKSLRLLPEFDSEFGKLIEGDLSLKFDITVATSSRVLEVTKTYNQLKITFAHAGVKREIAADQLLIAESLQPQVDLGLNNAMVNYETNGLITNEFLQTTNKNVFGAGNVLGMHNQPQIAVLEAETAFFNLVNSKKRTINYQYLPQIIQTIPKLAKVGLSEDDCLKQDIDHKIIISDFKQAPHNILHDQPTTGLIKIILNNKKQIIGATVYGPEAEGIIHQLALAINHNFTIEQLIEIPSTFLSWYEIINIAGNKRPQ